MTASEIKRWAGIPDGADVIESALLSLWEAGASGQIRPAKYPHETNLFRLWGHEEVVGRRDRSEIETRRLGESVALELLDFASFEADVFLSFSSHDYQLALDVRLYLAQLQVRAWMYQAIPNRALIVEGVREAMANCDAVLALLTCHSLGSAWVYSEIHSASSDIDKPIYALIDATDQDLLALLQTTDPGRPHVIPPHLLEPLLHKYQSVESDARTEKYERVLSDQLTSMRYCYSGAALFPPASVDMGSERLKMFMDPGGLVIAIKQAAATRALK
jgi:hypothetical protein